MTEVYEKPTEYSLQKSEVDQDVDRIKEVLEVSVSEIAEVEIEQVESRLVSVKLVEMKTLPEHLKYIFLDK